MLIKREIGKIARREQAGIVLKKVKVSNRDRKNEVETYGEL
jgi:hypothetical protein